MTDHFATFDLPHSVWLDAEELKERFHRLSAQRHPDAPGGSGAAFERLNAAWQILREPAARLRHYLELEHPGALGTDAQPPAELADLFMDIAAFRQDAQRFATRKTAATSPLTRALLEPERVALQTCASSLNSEMNRLLGATIARLGDKTLTREDLTRIQVSLTYLGKWAPQISDSQLAL